MMPPETTLTTATEALMQAKRLAVRAMDAALPDRQDGETDGAYFRRLLGESQRAREAVQTHETWKRRHLNGLRPQDLDQRLLMVLGEILRSAFLRADYYDTGLPADDLRQATEELQQRGYGELCPISGSDWKYALLRQVLCQQATDRIIIDEAHAGFYLSELKNQLTWGDAEAFFRFQTFTRLVYQEMDALEQQSQDAIQRQLETKVLEALKPLSRYVSSEWSRHYDELLQALLRVDGLTEKLQKVSPRGFLGGYNQKLVCNLVGLLCNREVYRITPKQADGLIYTNQTHYTYINNYHDVGSTNTVLTDDNIKAMKEIVAKYKEKMAS